MSLQFSLAGPQIKCFKVVLQSLAKTSASELLIEAFPDQLILRSINTSRSAYLAVNLGSAFFDEFQAHGRVIQAAILLKDALVVFGSSKTVRVSFQFASADERVTARLFGENGLKKVYGIVCLNTDVLNANVSEAEYPVTMVVGGPDLQRLLSSFQSDHDELTIVAHPCDGSGSGSCELRTFHDPAGIGKISSSLRTELSFDTQSLMLLYEHTSGDSIHATFNVQDLKAVVFLCGQLGADVCIKMHSPGIPLIVEPRWPSSRMRRDINLHTELEAKLVLATLAGSQITPSIERARTTVDHRGGNPSAAGDRLNFVDNATTPARSRINAPAHSAQQSARPGLRDESNRRSANVALATERNSTRQQVTSTNCVFANGGSTQNTQNGEPDLWGSLNEARELPGDHQPNFSLTCPEDLPMEYAHTCTISQPDNSSQDL